MNPAPYKKQQTQNIMQAIKKRRFGGPTPKKPRFGAKEKVSGAVAQRSGARLAALGGSVDGVDGTDGYTGHEARLIKKARLKQRNSRRTMTGLPYRGKM